MVIEIWWTIFKAFLLGCGLARVAVGSRHCHAKIHGSRSSGAISFHTRVYLIIKNHYSKNSDDNT